MLKRRVLERGLRAERVEEVGCGSVIKVQRGWQLPCRGPWESGRRVGAEAGSEKGTVMDRVGREHILSAWLGN